MAYNQKAWQAVLRYMPTHYIGATGPCCDHCSRALAIATEAISYVTNDDPEMDGTDFAHPAYLRGEDATVKKFCKIVNDILDGTKANVGTSSEPWQQLRQRLYDIRTLLEIAERVITQLPYDRMSQFYLSISQWYKVRQDYAKRRKQ